MAHFSFSQVVAIPVEGAAGDEASKEVVGSNGSAATNDE